MIDVKKVWLRRAEGETRTLGTRTVSSIEEANQVIKGWGTSAPKYGGYDKVDFKVTWADGEVYEGRYDMTYENSRKANIGEQVRSFMEFYGGLYRPPHMDEDQYEKAVKLAERRSGHARERYIEFIRARELS